MCIFSKDIVCGMPEGVVHGGLDTRLPLTNGSLIMNHAYFNAFLEQEFALLLTGK
jgi:hypothetical protein